MLCRAVLTAVAISCTFTREVIGQGSPRKVQIKDLICVLWLSGMQKEDLDVNMLRKLQRHNVNIDDMNPESLKQQCLNFKLNKDNAINDDNKGADNENETTTEIVKLDREKYDKQLDKSDLTMILSNLMDTKTAKGIEHNTFSENKESAEIKQSVSENKTNQNQANKDSPLEIDKTDEIVIKYNRGQPELDSILNFWRMLTTTSAPYTHEPYDMTTRKPKHKERDIERKPIHINQRLAKQKYEQTFEEIKAQSGESAEFINKLLADFVSKHTKPTTEKVTTAAIDLKKFSDQIEKLLKLFPQRGTLGYSNNFPESEVEIINDVKPVGYYYIKNGIPQKSDVLFERFKQFVGYENSKNSNNLKNLNFKNDNPTDFLKQTEMVAIREPVQDFKQQQKEATQYYKSTDRNIVIFEPTDASKTTVIPNSKNVAKKADIKIITKDVIKEIAENVKAIVLKDLRREVTTTSSSTTVASTTSMTIASLPIHSYSTTIKPLAGVTCENQTQNKTQEPTQVIAKFMELFEQMKKANERTTSVPFVKTTLNESHQGTDKLISINKNPTAVMIDPYRVRKPPENMQGFFNPFGIQSPGIAQNFPVPTPNFVNMNPIPLMPQGFHKIQAKPIMLQTNSDEIQPLGIPILKPLNLIHQNIVVTTEPYPTQKYHRDKWVDQYQHTKTINRNEKYKYPPLPPSHAGYSEATKLDRMHYKDDKVREFGNVFKDKLVVQDRYNNNRLLDFKQSFRDDPKSLNQRPYMNARLRDLKLSLNEDSTHKDRRLPEFKDETKNLHRTSYGDERTREYKDETNPGLFESTRYKHGNSNRGPHKPLYDDVINLKINENKREYGHEKKHYDKVSYGVLSHNKKSKRFHERLEGLDERRDSRENAEDKTSCGKLDVASRQQRPLNMKSSRFDDTHFNNFLKTQQKVNDMLEKILSAKARPNGPRSVETT